MYRYTFSDGKMSGFLPATLSFLMKYVPRSAKSAGAEHRRFQERRAVMNASPVNCVFWRNIVGLPGSIKSQLQA